MIALEQPENTNTLILAERAQYEESLHAAFIGMTFSVQEEDSQANPQQDDQIEALESSRAQGLAISAASIDIYRMLEVLSSTVVEGPTGEIASRIDALSETTQDLEDVHLEDSKRSQ